MDWMSGTEYYPLLSCHYEKDSVSWVRYPYGCEEEVEEGIGLTPWSGADHPVGEGKRASRAGELSVTTTATTGRSSTLVWHLILPISRVGSKAAWRGSVRTTLRRNSSSVTSGRMRPRGRW